MVLGERNRLPVYCCMKNRHMVQNGGLSSLEVAWGSAGGRVGLLELGYFDGSTWRFMGNLK